MALNHLSVPGKLLEVADGTKYAYIHIPAKDSKPTILFLHGIPSSSYDWRHQIKLLSELGYGVVAPDLLGYVDTDKPVELERYKYKKMAACLVKILDEESLGEVIGVAHDWGSRMLARMWNYHSERLSALVFTSVPYAPPAPFDIDTVNDKTQKLFGYPTYGYWKFFNEDDAAELCDRNHEYLASLLYPTDPAIWKTDMAPLGAAKAWVTANTVKPRPAWLSESEASIHDQLLVKGGYTGPFNWYKSTIRHVDAEDDAELPKERKFVVDAPTMLVVSDEDYVTRAEIAEQLAPVWLKNYRIKKIMGAGHWIQLEKRDEYNEILLDFIKQVSK